MIWCPFSQSMCNYVCMNNHVQPCWWVCTTSNPRNQFLVLLQQPLLIIPLFLRFWSILVFDSNSTHPHAPEPLQNYFTQCLKPRRHSPDHPQSQDNPFLGPDSYMWTSLPEHFKIRPVHYDFLIDAFLGTRQSSGVMINPPLYFLFCNISIFLIVSPISHNLLFLL